MPLPRAIIYGLLYRISFAPKAGCQNSEKLWEKTVNRYPLGDYIQKNDDKIEISGLDVSLDQIV